MTEQDTNSAKPTSLNRKLASLHPDRRKKIEACAERMHDEILEQEAILDELVANAQENDMGY